MADFPSAAPQDAVDVYVDGSGRVGLLAYHVPSGMLLSPGDEVLVPYGQSTRQGMVVGPALSPELATKEVFQYLGLRAHPLEVGLSRDLALEHFADFRQIIPRLGPSVMESPARLDAGPLTLASFPAYSYTCPADLPRRLYLRSPLVDPAQLAAQEALRMAAFGQVLILCPTVSLVDKVMACFTSGAARLDAKARLGAVDGFRQGTVPVGVGTRTSALYPADALGGVILLEEDHPGHVEASAPHTSALEVASRRSLLHGCLFTVISSCPTPLGLAAKLKVVQVGSRSDWPGVRVVDRSKLPPSERRVPLRVRTLIDKALKDGVPVVALAERNPARRLCHKCHAPRSCVSCAEVECSHVQPPCPVCQETSTSAVGFDIPRLTRILKVPAMTLAALEALPEAARLVVILDADSLFSYPSPDPLHPAMRVLLSAAQAAGPGGSLLLVTSQPEHPVLKSLESRDLDGFAHRTWDFAKSHVLPPFGRVVTIRSARGFKTANWPGLVLGPRKRQGEHEVMVRLTDAQLSELRPTIERLRKRGKTRVWLI